MPFAGSRWRIPAPGPGPGPARHAPPAPQPCPALGSCWLQAPAPLWSQLRGQLQPQSGCCRDVAPAPLPEGSGWAKVLLYCGGNWGGKAPHSPGAGNCGRGCPGSAPGDVPAEKLLPSAAQRSRGAGAIAGKWVTSRHRCQRWGHGPLGWDTSGHCCRGHGPCQRPPLAAERRLCQPLPGKLQLRPRAGMGPSNF